MTALEAAAFVRSATSPIAMLSPLYRLCLAFPSPPTAGSGILSIQDFVRAFSRKDNFMWMRRLVVFNQVAVLLGTTARLLASRKSKLPVSHRVAESLLSWSLPLNLGILETFFFARHVLHRGRTTEQRERPEEDLAHSEVAVAHLAFGVLGLLSVRFRGMFWVATVIGQAVFLIGVAAIHAREISKDKMFLFDILVSLMHVGLLKAYDPRAASSSRAVRRRL